MENVENSCILIANLDENFMVQMLSVYSNFERWLEASGISTWIDVDDHYVDLFLISQ